MVTLFQKGGAAFCRCSSDLLVFCVIFTQSVCCKFKLQTLFCIFFPPSLCGVLVFLLCARPPLLFSYACPHCHTNTHTQLFQTQQCHTHTHTRAHTQLFHFHTHTTLSHKVLSHATLSHTHTTLSQTHNPFTKYCHTHNFVTHTQLCHK